MNRPDYMTRCMWIAAILLQLFTLGLQWQISKEWEAMRQFYEITRGSK